jgi:predicted anti-sigma-YlaC factor YlaD
LSRTRVPDDWREALAWLAPLPVVFAFVLWPATALGLAYPLAVALAILGTYLLVNLTIVSVLPFAEGRAERLRDLWPAVLVAAVLTVIEIAASAWLRVLLTRFTGGAG